MNRKAKPARVKGNEKKWQGIYAIDSAPLDGTLTRCRVQDCKRIGN